MTRGSLLALLVVLGMTPPVGGAVILDREVSVAIDGPAFVERLRLRVLIDDPGDTETWSRHPVYLDDDIELETFAIEVARPDGAVDKVPRRRLRKETSVGFGLHSSAYAMVADLPALHLGDEIRIDISRRFAPSYPSYRIQLAGDDDQRRLKIVVSGGGSEFRWRLSGWEDLLEIDDQDGRLTVSGTDLARHRPRAFEPDGDLWLPSLWLAWGDDRTWNGVGRWYADLVDASDPDTATVVALAKKLTEDANTPRDRLASIASYVKRTIRYEAVEIGDGGYVPSTPAEVIGRGWGDCKDKAHLLIELLAAVGIPGRMALIRMGRDGQVVEAFPSPLYFNHAIAAVPAEAAGALEGDPVVEGLLFIDATMDRGDPLWLSPFNRGQTALVVGADTSRLVAIPNDPGDEIEHLEVTGRVNIVGTFSGSAVLHLIGSRALPWIRGLDTIPPHRLDQAIRQNMQEFLGGATVTSTSWVERETGVPGIDIEAAFEIRSFALRSSGRTRFRPGLMSLLPGTRALDDRTRPVVLDDGRSRSSWTIVFAHPGCPVESIDLEIDNDAGRLSHTVRSDGPDTVFVDRTVTLDRWWFDETLFDDLRELSIAESRSSRRSVRMTCPGAAPDTAD